jgi:AraC family transcriptional regulator, ethanolamine operon transcriptional activator
VADVRWRKGEAPNYPARNLGIAGITPTATLFRFGTWSSIGIPQNAIVKRPLFTGTQPAVTVVEISDPTAAGAGIELIEQDAVQLQPMSFRARRVIVRLGASSVVFYSTNRRVRTRTRARRGLLAYVTFGPRSNGTVNGLPVSAGLMLAAAPDAEASFVADAGYESVTFLLPPDEIHAHLKARQREGEFRLPLGVETLQVDGDNARRLFAWGKRLVDAAARQPALFNERETERIAAHVELVELLLAILGGALDYEPSRSDRTRQAQSLVVKVAEDYALSQISDHLYVSDLCRVAAVSERTLEYAFKEVMGLTPVTYLIRLRLHRVRRALLASTQGSTTVSTEALNWGFWHFGEFSRAYKDCFDELPSDTLRRKPGELQT